MGRLKIKLVGLRGGLHKIEFELSPNAPKSGANIDLPLAGAEVNGIIEADLKKADSWADTINTNYKKKLMRKLWDYCNPVISPFYTLDYFGRPNNPEAPSCVRFNQVSESGFGGVCTWFGVPVRVAKLSNFMYGYIAAKIGFSWTTSIGRFVGTPDDKGSELSVRLGVDIAKMKYNYGDVKMKEMIKEIRKGTEDKNKTQRLWPNPKPSIEGLSSPKFSD